MSNFTGILNEDVKTASSYELGSSDFSEFFLDIHGYEPFPWQQRLTSQVLNARAWPKVIDLPTGTGKTAVLDTAVFAMATQPTTFPRRVVFVIDRRIVVDQVYERAQRILDRLKAADTPVLKWVRDRLQEMGSGEVLGVAALRGGIPIDDEWTYRPDQPWVVVSTVDQLGSRLLFRGYGVTPRMRPIHAGLAGNDCLVILDEVHLSVPFAETLAQISSFSSGPLPRRFEVVQMSATSGDESIERFTLDPKTDLSGCVELRRRVEAKKQAKLKLVQNRDAIPATVLKIVRSIDKSIRNNETRVRSIGVIVNRVDTARKTHNALLGADYLVYLITGRMRPLDRISALEKIEPAIDPDADRCGGQLTIVVATQAIEVGADFSFDALVTECASVDSLRQRFGRLDRRGTWSERAGCPALAWIIGPRSVVISNKLDPIYGSSAKATWEELERLDKKGPLDIGPMTLRHFPDEATAPRKSAPLLLKTYMDAWAQTCPEPIVQPSVDWFLHGIGEEHPADVSILWRWDRSTEALRLVPPRQVEFVQLPISAVKSWLAGDEEVEIGDVTYIQRQRNSQTEAKTSKNWSRWKGFGDGIDDDLEIKDIRPGDILVVDPMQGGLHAGTWDPSSKEPVEDLGDAAQIEYGRTATLRLDGRSLHLASLPKPAEEYEADTNPKERISSWLEALRTEPDSQPNWLQCTIQRLGGNFEINVVGINDRAPDDGYYILIEHKEDSEVSVVDVTTMDGSDETGSYTGTGVSLSSHLDGVGKRAENIARRLGLSADIASDIRLAGRLHDLGKVDSRFQLQLVGGDPVELEMRRNEPLAKSLPGARRKMPTYQTRMKYPKGMRHEAASLAMIQSNYDVLTPAYDKDLVLHLVGTHHGWGRPFLPIIDDPEPQILSCTLDGKSMGTNSDLTANLLSLDMADRFWRLVECYGYYGLAWLEAILRLADHQQSAEEAKQI